MSLSIGANTCYGWVKRVVPFDLNSPTDPPSNKIQRATAESCSAISKMLCPKAQSTIFFFMPLQENKLHEIITSKSISHMSIVLFQSSGQDFRTQSFLLSPHPHSQVLQLRQRWTFLI
ncbi:hypothetical protein V6N12_005246 [Hibiscus sabdariffa]|uniref:Uncharacterized protein n=1 Tax=Hibiscus sabdariffa TaxID=183260 RepID=A0ABR2CNW5_9ROSI